MDAPARGALRFGGVQGHSEGEGSHAGSQGDDEVMEMSGPDLEMVRSHGDTQGHVEMMRSCGDNQGHREMIRVRKGVELCRAEASQSFSCLGSLTVGS